jgi:ribosomal protein L32
MRGKPQPLMRVVKREEVEGDWRRRVRVTLECGHTRMEARSYAPSSPGYRHCSTCGAAERRRLGRDEA